MNKARKLSLKYTLHSYKLKGRNYTANAKKIKQRKIKNFSMRNSMKYIKWNRYKFINFQLWVRENTKKYNHRCITKLTSKKKYLARCVLPIWICRHLQQPDRQQMWESQWADWEDPKW